MRQSNPTTVPDEPPVESLLALQLQRTMKSWPARLIVGVVLSAAALYFSFRDLHVSDILAGLASADLGLISGAIAIVLVNIVGKTMRWRVLLGRPGRLVHFFTLLRALLLGQILNIALPSRIGDVSRAYMIGSAGIGWPFVAGTIVTEKGIDLICYMLCFFLTLTFLPSLPVWVTTSVYSFVTVTLILVVLLIVLPHGHGLLDTRYLGWAPQALRERAARVMRAISSSFTVARQPWVAAQIIVWSALIWGTAVLTNYLLLLALAVDAPAISAVLLLIVLQISVSLPSVPGNIGLFQYICVLTLSVFGVSQAMAVSYGILLHLVAFVPPILLGSLLFAVVRSRRIH